MNSRELALIALNDVFNKKSYSNLSLNNYLSKYKLDFKEAALATEVFYGTIRYKYTIDKILENFIKRGIKSVNNVTINILRISIYQIRYLDKIPDFAVVNEGVKLTKKYRNVKESKFVNGVLRSYLRNLNSNFCKDKDYISKLCFKYSFEKWMVKRIIDQYGEEVGETILNGLNETPYVTIRVNNIKVSYEELKDKLINLNYNLEEGKVSPEAIHIIKGSDLQKNILFKEGFLTVQDESAMMVAPAMDLKEGMNVLDLCSAPGGKSTHIAEIMRNTGKIFSCDIYKNKLSLIKENVNRLGITNIECMVQNAEELNKDFIDFADRVLIDVPCSGIGIIKKKPEIKWNKNINDLRKIRNIQRNIMINASKYVKKEGVLLYSTCTLDKDENEKNINWFIKKFPNYKIEPLFFGDVDNIIYHKEGYITILPNKHMDGFFIAKLKRMW